eukprot:TRINITY_DN5603_c0_g1_i2.p1 TRINITY_DN5603_c0_g1~~TRINITY_DN5603_c0_g1_i2.p1  ORF type:complete len:245 (-),score=32.50 TRINITY_DN5603_c0_g1_i2:15-749(-)
MSQQEKSILEVHVAVFNYDNNIKNWAAKDAGSSRVFIFHNPNNNTYRIIGQSTADKQYNINTPIKPEMVHKKLRDNFVQWRFRDVIYGLNFKTNEDADRFFSMVTKVIERLQGSQNSPLLGAPSQQPQSTLPAPVPTMRHGSSYGVTGVGADPTASTTTTTTTATPVAIGTPPQPTGPPPALPKTDGNFAPPGTVIVPLLCIFISLLCLCTCVLHHSRSLYRLTCTRTLAKYTQYPMLYIYVNC